MKKESLEKIQAKLELATRKWWFFLIFLFMQFIPPYASKGYEWPEMGMVTGEILGHAIISNYAALYPIFKIAPIILFILIIFLRNGATRLFSIYVAINYVLIAFLQNIALTEKYGLGIVTINFIMFLLVAIFWIWEAIAQKNDFTLRKQPPWKYWVIPLAFLAFWYPANPNTLMPDFNPIYLFINGAGLTFCMMTPVYLAILTLYHPRVNIATLRITSLVGLIIAFYNLWVNFFINPSVLWWNGVLHIPLLSISLYAFVLSLRKNSLEETKGD
ncbi:MAG: hypothetical protein PHS99_08920 [Candidatus Marinimicrobia bacterium]|nr:hypothetical protein [Candidatus Neomarinimicrobiota bacterium]